MEISRIRRNERFINTLSLLCKNLSDKSSMKKTIALEHIKNISRPREIDLSEIHRDPSPTFQPSKTKEALNAMRNKKCGYDFIERLNDRGDFMDRMHQGKKF